ncbi:MAG TPA: NUDIX hydrolase [Acidimicrobiales bacterium]|nr:NUDIX hydrolase [Acidimicrobiales bacterium]
MEAQPPAFVRLDDAEVHRASRFTVHRSRFRAPDGTEFERDIVRHPGAVGVVPLHEDGTVTLVRQYRAALDVELLELPAGLRDVDGEPDERTAERELVEEAGLAAARVEHLVTFHNSPGFCDESVAVFLATGLTPVADDRQGVEEEAMTIERLPLADALAMVADGRITDAKTIIGLSLAVGHAG